MRNKISSLSFQDQMQIDTPIYHREEANPRRNIAGQSLGT